jgi:hypothetical protein
MKLIAALISISLGISSSVWGATVEGKQSGTVRVIPMKPSPEPDEVEVRFAFPLEGEVKTSNPVTAQLRIEAFPLGFKTDLPRARQIRDSKKGQSIHIIVDGKHHFDINEAIDDVAENEEIDFDQIIQAKIPYKLSEGIHILRAFPIWSFDECLKGPKCFAAMYFYFGKAEKSPSIDLSQPYLTIDGSDERTLTDWVPYFIYGLKKGSHTIKLELRDPQNKVLPPLFKDLEQTIVVK